MHIYKSGDWVFCNDEDSPLYGATGYIMSPKSVSAKVHFIKTEKGASIDVKPIMEFRKLIPAMYKEPLTKETFDIYMDLALQTKDYDLGETVSTRI